MGLENFRNRLFGKVESEADDTAPRLRKSKDDDFGSISPRSFEYYSHRVDQTAPEVWNEMINGLENYKRVVGILKEDGIVCWSDQAFTHSVLIGSALTKKEVGNDSVAAFLEISKYESSINVSVFSHQLDETEVIKLVDYLDRNITENKEDINLSVRGRNTVNLDDYIKGIDYD